MSQPLQILIVEDSPDDAELMVRALQSAGFELSTTRVDSESSLRAALERQSWDLILCDYNLPGFGAVPALALARQYAITVPILIVSGSIGEEKAVELVRQGAADVLRKENVDSRLALAVQRELAFAEVRRREEKLHAEVAERTHDLREMQTLLSAIVSSSDDAMFTETLDGIITTWNAGAERIFGYSAEEMIGQPASIIAAPGREDDMIKIRELVKHGERINHYETQRRRKDGAIIYISLTVSPINDAKGHVIGASKIARDVTAAREAEKALRASEAKYRNTFDIAPIGIIHISKMGQFFMVNDFFCNLVGYERAELLTKTFFDITNPEDVEKLRTMFDRRRSKDASPGSIVKRYQHKSGHDVWCELTFTPQYADAGDFLHSIAIVADISARKAAEERQLQLAAQLQQAQKMEAIGQLTGGMAHDFNNLLGVVLGNLDFLEEKFAPGSDELELTQAAAKAALHGADLTRRLLAFSRQQPLAPKVTELASVLDGAAQLFRRVLGENISLKVDLSHDLWPVLIDVPQLESAILNLAVNARDAMPNGGSLTIEARNVTLDDSAIELNPEAKSGAYLAISVADTGSGMPPEVIAKVFEPFFTTKGNLGTGLGLSMVHGFVKQSGGHTRIYSEVGIGTIVTIHLPRAHTLADEDADLQAPFSAATGNEMILVVEDNAGLRDIAIRRLQDLGYRTISANDGSEALEIIRGGAAFDLLFTDVVMPGTIDGRALAGAARRLRPTLKVLFTSGFTAAAASATMIEEFSSNLLTKPYRKDELARSVRSAIDGST